MSTKVYDIAVKTGSYMKDGQEKGRYKNIGCVMKNDDGGSFMILDRTFNGAGLPNPEGRDTYIASLFEPKDQQQSQSQAAQQAPAQHQTAPAKMPQAQTFDSQDSDVPF